MTQHTVRLPPAVSDALCRLSLRHHVSVYSLLARAVKSFVVRLQTKTGPPLCATLVSSPSRHRKGRIG